MEGYVLIVIATTATVLTIILFLMRVELQENRPFAVFTRWWAAASPQTSAVVFALLSVIAVSSFSNIPIPEGTRIADALQESGDTLASNESVNTDQDLEALREYAGKIVDNTPSTAHETQSKIAETLPDVGSMIAKLLARLETQPDDVKGWKMLGWSYLNTNRAGEAAKAYETALKLEPGDAEIKKGLEAAKAVHAGTTTAPTSDAEQYLGATKQPKSP